MNIILASGTQERWNKNNNSKHKIKQLLPVKGEILIERIQRQFESTVITHNEKIIRHSGDVFKPEKYSVTIETLLSTSEVWQYQTIILLGDVFYSDSCVEIIKEFKGEIMFFGTKDEIFAISFNNHNRVKNCLNAVLKRNRFDGRLWQLYRIYHGYNRAVHTIEDNFTFIEDETQDFDYIEEYNKFING